MNGGYLVIVPAADRALFEYLEHQFKGDPSTSVLVERRKVARPSPRAVVLFHGVSVGPPVSLSRLTTR